MVRASASEGVNMYLILWGQAQMQGKESEFWGRGCQLINYLKVRAEEVWALEKGLEFRERGLYSKRVRLVYPPQKAPLFVLHTRACSFTGSVTLLLCCFLVSFDM